MGLDLGGGGGGGVLGMRAWAREHSLAKVPKICLAEPRKPLARPMSSGLQYRGHMIRVISSR